MDKRIGAQFYTIRESCKTIEDFEESCRKVAKIGYKIVQLSGIGPMPAEEIKAVLDKYGLEAVVTHRSKEDYEEHLEETIAFHKTIGCKIAGLGSMPGFSCDKENFEDFIAKYTPIAEELHKNGLVFAYHNHQIEFAKRDGKFIFEELAERTNPDHVKFILDVYWLSYSGIDPAKFIRKYKDRLACVHFKDLGIIGKEINMFEVGYGNLDWDEIIAACEEANVPYALVEQDVCRRDPFESLQMSYDYLTQKGFC